MFGKINKPVIFTLIIILGIILWQFIQTPPDPIIGYVHQCDNLSNMGGPYDPTSDTHKEDCEDTTSQSTIYDSCNLSYQQAHSTSLPPDPTPIYLNTIDNTYYVLQAGITFYLQNNCVVNEHPFCHSFGLTSCYTCWEVKLNSDYKCFLKGCAHRYLQVNGVWEDDCYNCK